MKTLRKIRALAREEKTFYKRGNVDIDPALTPGVQRILHELKTLEISKVEGFWSREKALKWGEDLARECRVRAGPLFFNAEEVELLARISAAGWAGAYDQSQPSITIRAGRMDGTSGVL